MEDTRRVRGMGGLPLFVGVAGSITAASIASIAELGAEKQWSSLARLTGMPAVGIASALIALIFAVQLKRGRTQTSWTLVAVGAACLAFAAAASAPGVPVSESAAMLLMAVRALAYVLFAGVAVSSAYHHRERVDLAWPVVESFVTTAAVALVTWLVVLRSVMVAPGTPSERTVLDQTFLIGDLAFLVGPMLMLALALVRLREPVETAPWLLLGTSTGATVLAEVAWFAQAGPARSIGSLADFFWMLGMVGIGVSAALAWDADRVSHSAD